jgi:hypothetical protein
VQAQFLGEANKLLWHGLIFHHCGRFEFHLLNWGDVEATSAVFVYREFVPQSDGGGLFA